MSSLIDFETQRHVMSEPFNIIMHKNTFTHYLEICLDPTGMPHYAVPSHQSWLENYACSLLSITRDELLDRCPPEFYSDYMNWLVKLTDCVAVWDMSYVGSLNSDQKAELELLQLNDLCVGPIIADCAGAGIDLGKEVMPEE